MDDNGAWDQFRKGVIRELDGVSVDIKTLDVNDKKQNERLAVLETKAGIVAAVVSAIMSAIVAVLMKIFDK